VGYCIYQRPGNRALALQHKIKLKGLSAYCQHSVGYVVEFHESGRSHSVGRETM